MQKMNLRYKIKYFWVQKVKTATPFSNFLKPWSFHDKKKIEGANGIGIFL